MTPARIFPESLLASLALIASPAIAGVVVSEKFESPAVTGSCEWSPAMVTWYQDDRVDGPTVTTVATPDSPDPNVTTVVATIGGTVPEKLFLRVVATQP